MLSRGESPANIVTKGQNHDHKSTNANRHSDLDHEPNHETLNRTPSSQAASLPKRIDLTKDEFFTLDKDQIYTYWRQQNARLDALETNLNDSTQCHEVFKTKTESIEKSYKRKLHEATHRENHLKMKLAFRDKKLQDLQSQLTQVTQSQFPTAHHLEATLIDPAINLMFEKMKSEVESAKTRAEEMQNELSAWKFTPDSNTGKRLMAKCRLLHNENEELGKDISSGWVAQLTGNLALQKKFSEEMKKSQSELDEFLLELEEEVEGMQNTIYYLQQQLREAREERRQGCSTSENVSSPLSVADNAQSIVRDDTNISDKIVSANNSTDDNKCVDTNIEPIGAEGNNNSNNSSSNNSSTDTGPIKVTEKEVSTPS